MKTLTYDDISIIPTYSAIKSRSECNLETYITTDLKIKIPITSAPMDSVTESEMAIELGKLGGIGFIHRFLSIEDQIREIVKVKKCNYIVGAAIGVVGDYIKRTESLLNNGCDVILIDIAHGHHILMKEALKNLRDTFGWKVQIIAGNVCTEQGARDLEKWGANGIRCGIGGGSVCSTRSNTGIGVPQVTSLQNCFRAVKDTIPIIADGNIRMPGDVCKALALGASSVMIGSLFSGTKESPGNIEKQGIWPNEILFKKYRGSASEDSKKLRKEDVKNVEGVSTNVPYKGRIERIVSDITDGIRSSMSYTNSKVLSEFRKNAFIVEVSHAGMKEAIPYLIYS